MAKEFYVYVHNYASGPKKGLPFYVGKGSGNRYRFFHDRNKHWNNSYKKYGVECKIIRRFENEICAYVFESIIISKIGLDNLCNYSVGGIGGCKGYRWTEDQRNNHPSRNMDPECHHKYDATEYDFISPSGECIQMTKYNFSRKFGLNPGSVNSMVTGEVSSVFGWTIRGYKQTWRRRFYSEAVRFRHEVFGDFVGTRQEFQEKYKIPSHRSAELMRGSRKSCKGWKFVGAVKEDKEPGIE